MSNFYAVDAASNGGGGGGLVTSVSDTESIDLEVTAGDLTADLKLSAASAGAGNLKVTNSIETDGLLSQVPVGNLTDAGTDGIIVTGGSGAVIGTGTSIAQHVADASHNGYLSSTDWNTFNDKQSALTIGDLTDAGTDGIIITGGTGSVIGSGTSIAQHVADSTHNGYLSSADWSTFNGKQAAGNYITALTGDVAASGPGSAAASIQAGVITNSMVNASAGIAFSKLASLTSAHILVGSAGNVAIDTAVTGDISITNGGVTAYAGTVPINKGGTGQTTANPAFNALAPTTTKGDLIGYSTVNARLAVGSDGQVLTADSASSLGVKWAANTANTDSPVDRWNMSIAASVATNALTIALKDKSGSDPSSGSPVKVSFRNSTLATGDYTTVSVTGATSIVVPSGATLGWANGDTRYVYVYLINNGGTGELAVSSQMWDENALQTSTTIDTNADSSNVLYSTTGRTSKAIRWLAKVLLTEATAGTWATSPTEVSTDRQPRASTAMDNAEATRFGLKVYSHGTSYNNGVAPTITLTGGGGTLSSVAQGDFMPYQTSDGNWHVKFNIGLTLSSATRTFMTISVNGLTFFDSQAIAAQNTIPTPSNARVDSGASTMQVEHASATSTTYRLSGDVRLSAVPTFVYA